MEKKYFVKIVIILVTILLKVAHVFMYLQKTHFLSLFKIDTLNVTMYILIFTCL